jgi:hypothetical protein
MAASDLFEFINGMFSKPEEFKKTKMHERGRHFFMVNRLSSINFPVQAAAFNHIKINPAQAVTFWQELLSKRYNRTPSWMYVKTKKEKEKKAAALSVTEEVLRTYCEVHKISRRNLDDSIEILGDRMIDDIKKFAELLK